MNACIIMTVLSLTVHNDNNHPMRSHRGIISEHKTSLVGCTTQHKYLITSTTRL